MAFMMIIIPNTNNSTCICKWHLLIFKWIILLKYVPNTMIIIYINNCCILQQYQFFFSNLWQINYWVSQLLFNIRPNKRLISDLLNCLMIIDRMNLIQVPFFSNLTKNPLNNNNIVLVKILRSLILKSLT